MSTIQRIRLTGRGERFTLNTVELEAFLSRSWFPRLWTVEEAVLAAKATLLCGKDELDWIHFCRAAQDSEVDLADPSRHECEFDFDDADIQWLRDFRELQQRAQSYHL